MTNQQILETVRRHVRERKVAGASLEVLDQPLKREGDWWYVPIRPTQEFPRDHEYYEELLRIEEEIKRDEQLDILLIPA